MGKMKVFIDTNVLLDHLAMREGFHEDASIIFSMVNDGKLKAYISSISVVNCAYVLPKHYESKAVMQQISNLLRLFSVTNVDSTVLQKALSLSPYDFEDAVQYASALPYKPDIIITRDKKGFRDFPIKTMTPSEFVAACKK